MDKDVRDRVIEEAKCFIDMKTTVRGVSKILGISKSTVHKDFVERLETINYDLYQKVIYLLKYNKDVRHIRGGQATKKLYEDKRHKA